MEVLSFLSFVCVSLYIREDDKHSLDIHDNPPVPDNVVKEDGDTVSGRTMSILPSLSTVPFWDGLK